MDNILTLTGWKWPFEPPKSYGWYHLSWFLIMVLLCILFGIRAKRPNEKDNNNHVILGFGIFLFAIELYKQVFCTIEDGGYRWSIFPFQFCSIPIYVCLITPFVKEGKLREMFISFLSFYGTAAGLSVMFYPSTCLNTSYVTILLHTMAWHSSMVILGVYLLISNGYGKTVKEILPGFAVFFSFMVLAVILNFAVYGITGDVYCNFMYLSKYDETPFPILDKIQDFSYILYLICYFIAFSLATVIVFYGAKLGGKISSFTKNEKRKDS